MSKLPAAAWESAVFIGSYFQNACVELGLPELHPDIGTFDLPPDRMYRLAETVEFRHRFRFFGYERNRPYWMDYRKWHPVQFPEQSPSCEDHRP